MAPKLVFPKAPQCFWLVSFKDLHARSCGEGKTLPRQEGGHGHALELPVIGWEGVPRPGFWTVRRGTPVVRIKHQWQRLRVDDSADRMRFFGLGWPAERHEAEEG